MPEEINVVSAKAYPGHAFNDQTVIIDWRNDILLEPAAAPGDPTNKLYNDLGVLSFNGAAVGNINSGVAGRLALYPSTGIEIDDIYVQNGNDIDITIASHATLAAPRVYTIPDAGANASFIMSSGALVFTPSSTQSIVAANGITAAMIVYGIVRIQGSGGAVTVSATPSVAAGSDGQIIILQGDSDANTVTLNDEATTAGSKLQLNAGANCTLGKGDILMLTYDSGDGYWYEICRSNN